MAHWKSSEIQTILFDKDFFTRRQAVAWAKRNDKKHSKVDETENYFRLRQRPPSAFERGKVRTIALTDGVKAVIGVPKTRSNPVEAGQHPDLFGGTSAMYADWRDMSEEKLIRAFVLGQVPEEDASEIEEEAPELFGKMEEADEEAREERIKPIVTWLNGEAGWGIEYETEGDGVEQYQDLFQEWLANEDVSDLIAHAVKLLSESHPVLAEQLEDSEDDDIEEILRDPGIFDIGVENHSYYSQPGVYQIHIDELHREVDVGDLKESIGEEIDANEKEYGRPRPSDEDDIEHDLENVTVSGDGLERLLEAIFKKKERRRGIDLVIHTDKTVYWDYDVSLLAANLSEVLGDEEEPKKESKGKADDDVVYELPDGFYVADLPAGALPMEGRKQGICVGQKSMGYIDAVKNGEIKIFSLRTSGGKPKLTIEGVLDDEGNVVEIEQIKGKANRIPGFNPGQHDVLKHPTEVALVSEFIESLGINPRDVKDLRPGYDAWQASLSGSARKNPPEIISKKIKKLADEAYYEPWGGVM